MVIFDSLKLNQQKLDAHYISDDDLKKEQETIIGEITAVMTNQHLGPQLHFKSDGKFYSCDAFGDYMKLKKGQDVKITYIDELRPMKIEIMCT